MRKTNLTCIECPIGCAIEVETEGETVLSVVGNSCPRGKTYAENEVVCPKRVLTTCVRAESGEMLPVKTDAPVKKSELFTLMKKINALRVQKPVKIGDILVEKIDGEANLVATGNLE